MTEIEKGATMKKESGLDKQGIDWSKKDMYEGIGRPDLKRRTRYNSEPLYTGLEADAMIAQAVREALDTIEGEVDELDRFDLETGSLTDSEQSWVPYDLVKTIINKLRRNDETYRAT